MNEKTSDPKPKALPVKVGMQVELELIDLHGQPERIGVQIVPQRAADFAAGRLGENTPLAKAILGRFAGSVLPYRVGDLRQVKILSVQPAQADELPDAEARRTAAIQNALDEASQRDAMIFASSFSGKWGDYDPEGVKAWKKEPPQQPDEES